MDLREYSTTRIGEVWTQEDHDFLVAHLAKIDALAQAAATSQAEYLARLIRGIE